MTEPASAKEVLEILEKDARTTPEQVATMTGLPLAKVKKLIAKAELDRTILKYKTVVNWDKVGDERVWALIEVKVTPERDKGFDGIAERIYRYPQARTVYLVSGAFDLAILVTGKNMQEIASFVSQKLAPLEAVHSTVTHFMLKRYKEDGDILEGAERMKRQPFAL